VDAGCVFDGWLVFCCFDDEGFDGFILEKWEGLLVLIGNVEVGVVEAGIEVGGIIEEYSIGLNGLIPGTISDSEDDLSLCFPFLT